MTQQEAITLLGEVLKRTTVDAESCTGDAATCPVEECMVCGVRDCPGNEPLHYHHDGCPYCWNFVEGYK